MTISRPASGPAAVAALLLTWGCGGDDPAAPGVAPDPEPPPALPFLDGTWSRAPDLPVGVHRPAVFVHDGRLHLLGGARVQYGSDAGTSDALWVLDPDGGAWTPGPTYPVDGWHIAAASVGGAIFGVGGVAFPGTHWDRFFRLTDGNADWERLPDPGEPHGDLSAASANGRMLVLSQDGTRALWSYDPAADAWRERTPHPQDRVDVRLVSDGAAVYAVYGQPPLSIRTAGTSIYAYDEAADAWTERTLAQAARGEPGVALVGGRIHVVGGTDANFRPTTTHMVYEPATDTWYDAPPLPEPRTGLMGATLDGRGWFLAGGTPQEQPSLRREVWVFTPAS